MKSYLFVGFLNTHEILSSNEGDVPRIRHTPVMQNVKLTPSTAGRSTFIGMTGRFGSGQLPWAPGGGLFAEIFGELLRHVKFRTRPRNGNKLSTDTWLMTVEPAIDQTSSIVRVSRVQLRRTRQGTYFQGHYQRCDGKIPMLSQSRR